MRSDIVPGGRFPDFALVDHTNTRRKLEAIQGNDPMVVLLSRGHFCPKEHQHHLEIAALQSKVAVACTKLVTITTDDVLQAAAFRRAVGADWLFLCDPGRRVQRDLEIQDYTDPEHDPMLPHTIVLAPGMLVHKVYNGYWFWGRPSAQDLWQDLRDVTRAVRPDWDPSAPGLREAWEAGDRSNHYPYWAEAPASARLLRLGAPRWR
jgi:peroxiredoxin